MASIRGIAVVLGLCCLGAHPARDVFRHERFTIELPAGWRLARPSVAGGRFRFVPVPQGGEDTSGHEVSFADANGNFFVIVIDADMEPEVDALWRVRPGPDGTMVRIEEEGGRCSRPADPSYEGPCAAGDGLLQVGTIPALAIRGHAYVFWFGNTGKESGVDLEPFRAILRGIRFK